jgi:energy-coupling factor transporter ATP-binding protein EcfA2
MTDQQNICPYTGLRSFTEEESLYFKGRDLQVDQITMLLEQNKFLMVTGASGEGKSSLIYAGLIPNARAGFFKAKYTNWVVADFRPERDAVHNMADALAKTFESKPATIETELRRGFSSLIDLYTNSDFFIDEADEPWQQLEEPQRKNRKRKAANLLLIVDQFEEFFTNPENFYNEAPSQDSQIVVNLVLETARIAIKRNIPVYVVCTMRSDYIGQCSAFRGLPEYIGFSQFFVPRLKRKDLKQVIEEPAILSGNRISQRLIERLVYDIAEGVDQLPILQHALSQIWLEADRGNQEMDLIHYAKVGGMPPAELPDDEQPEFYRWFNELPLIRQNYYKETGLGRIIEIHASILYENAWEYYNARHPEIPVTQQGAKRIIALTFSCLTKIDNSRAVRNRMTLEEIAEIINTPSYTSEVVSNVLDIFREPGNSFIRPFKTDDPATKKISPFTVLDITHESLIRNWNKLNTWANQEFEFYSTYLDFKKQLDRWKNSGKSNGFLLPIGPLTYFENWYNKCKPNAGWIKRYTQFREDEKKAGDEAQTILEDTREFIGRSAKKVSVTRAFMKYGPQRIGIVLAIAIMLLLSGYYWYDAELKQNGSVISRVKKEMIPLMKSKEVGFDAKAAPLLIEERYEPGFMLSFLSGIEAKGRLSLSVETYKQLLLINKHDKSEYKTQLIRTVEAALKDLITKKSDYPYLLTELNEFTTLLDYDLYYNPSDSGEARLQDFVDEGYRIATIFFKTKSLFQATIPLELNYGIQQWLTFGHAGADKVNQLLKIVSPFEDPGGKEMFDVYYPKGSYEINGRVPNDFNGGYHTLASLYAAVGNAEKVIECLEMFKQSGENDYFSGNLFNNYNNILAIFYQFGHRDKAGIMLKWLVTNYADDDPLTVYRNSVIRSGYMSQFYRVNISKNILRSFKGYFFPNLCMASQEVFNELSDDYEKLISDIKDPSQRNYLLAINEKRKAIFTDKYEYDRGLKPDTADLNKILLQAVQHFRQVDGKFLDEKISITLPYYLDGIRKGEYKRRNLFIYPDYMEGWFSYTYHSDLFFNFIDQHNLFREFYTTPEEISYINLWLAKAYDVNPFQQELSFDNTYAVKDKTLTRILILAATHPQGRNLDLNLINMMLANRAFNRNETDTGMKYYHDFDKENFAASRDKYEYLEKTFFLNQLKNLCVNLALAGKQEDATDLAERFGQNYQKAYAYISMAEKVYMKQKNPAAFVYLDSVFSKSKDVDFSKFNYGFNRAIDYRNNLVLLLSRIGGKKLNAMSNDFLADIIEQNKFTGILSRVYGVAEEGNFFRAKTSLPATLTESEDLTARSYILWQACRKKESAEEQQKWKTMDDFLTNDYNYIFFMPN